MRLGELLCRLRGEGGRANSGLEALRSTQSDLESLARSTESEFLSIGERLQDVQQQSSEISKISSTVADLMSGKEPGNVIEGFRDVIDRMKQLDSESKRNTKNLEALTENLSHLGGHTGGFNEDIRQLRILCVSTRIESARADVAGRFGRGSLLLDGADGHQHQAKRG